MSDTIVKMTDVEKTFASGFLHRKQVHAVKGVSLEIKRGDVYGFLGPNGAGKTTTVRCMLALSRPTKGEILRFGKSDFSPKDFFAKTAFCPEESHFPPYMTGRAMLDHWAGLYGLSARAKTDKVEQTLFKVGLDQAADRKIGTYSKGMKQRVGIGGCLLTEPEFVVMDEPARGLDPLARNLVRNVLEELAKKGATIFMNSHILTEVERICTKAAIIHDGVVKKELSISELDQGAGLTIVYRPGENDAPALQNASDLGQGQKQIDVKDTAELAQISKQIADAKGEVISAVKKRIDLEQYFIKVVKEGE